MNKAQLVFLLLIFTLSALYGDDTERRFSPEQREKELLDKSYTNDDDRRLALIEAAEIRQLTGDLKGAADLFEQASLAVKGKKDFLSLYRASVLNTEMAFYRKAEADLRAILIYSENSSLRMRASVLTARIKMLQGEEEEALKILRGIISTEDNAPEEALYYGAGFFSTEEFDTESIFSDAAYLNQDPLLSPDIVFGAYMPLLPDDSGEPSDTKDNDKTAVVPASGVQLGSFSQEDNAAELKKVIADLGYHAEVRVKSINNKTYYSVVVPSEEGRDTQNLLIELKEKGYEGYPVY